MNGEIRSYSPAHGYGFVTSNSTDYFFHASEWLSEGKPMTGDKVTFFIKKSMKGPRAVKVRRL